MLEGDKDRIFPKRNFMESAVQDAEAAS